VRRNANRIACRGNGERSLAGSGRLALLLACGLLAPSLFGPSRAAAAQPPEPALHVAPSHSTDGTYQVHWDSRGRVRLEEARSRDFADVRVVYEGADQAATLSGRRDGTYHYRLVSLAAQNRGEAAPVASVEVAHHPLSRALLFFSAGLVVFTATVGLIVSGDRSARRV